MLDAIEKYKFGIFAVLLSYVGIFMYLQMSSYEYIEPYEPFYDGSHVEIPEDDIMLKPENIELNYESGEIRNIAQNVNDSREKSYEEYDMHMTPEEIEAEYKQLEQQMYQDAGGDKTRAEIREEIESRKQAELELQKQKELQQQHSNQKKTGNQYAGGNVMVKWDLREPHQNNDWYIRNPGYTCGHGATGTVMILIEVDNGGTVLSARYDAAQSGGNINSCMIEQAERYAKKSRFKYSSSAPKRQKGWISYTFVAQ